MRILITGAHGQLGQALVEALAAHELIALGSAELDVRDASCVRAWFDDERPEAVVHCAALTNTTLCEQDPALAEAVNAEGTANIARAAERAAVPLVAVSTNEVFDGSATSPVPEDAEPAPLNAYGRSKRRGEELALAACATAPLLIVRTSWVYGIGEGHFVAKVLAAARAGRPLRFVIDEIAAPTFVRDLAQAISGLLERGAPAGVYHLANEGETSRYGWACEILRLAGLDAGAVEAITTEQLYAAGYDGPRKPRYSALANTRARALGVTMPGWQQSLAGYFAKSRAAADA